MDRALCPAPLSEGEAFARPQMIHPGLFLHRILNGEEILPFGDDELSSENDHNGTAH